MKIVSEKADEYAAWREKNTDAYGNCIFLFAEAWADLMEVELARGRTVSDVAEECAREADARPGFGITGYMHSAAAVVLSHVWVHGEEFRRWYNVDVSPERGAEANKKPGAVLNAAILTIKGSGDEA